MPAISFLKTDVTNNGRVVADKVKAHQVRKMLERVTVAGGTATQAKVAGYKVAGKTGTVRKAGDGGYEEDNYLSVFAGYAPATNPRLAMVTIIDQPKSGDYYGGIIAAPVFSRVMAGALRLQNVAPDDFDNNLKLASMKVEVE
jgi:cell division protein FtsI (penicillin-binding protein 3)